jgi:4-alpha-glucanotransferase
VEAFVATHPYWATAWSRYAGNGALKDQVRFQREWARLRQHAADRDVKILGDVPFYVARGSADAAAWPGLFDADRAAGVPPDDWSATGQLWGNPTYDWPAMRSAGFRWWIERFRRTFELVDAVRLDHFRGFVSSWSVPYGERTALHGRWQRTPGKELFAAVYAELGEIRLAAENLGLITPAVERLRFDLGLPGTIVLQFVYADALLHKTEPSSSPHNIVYTGTHDNDTTLGWWSSANERTKANVNSALFDAGIVEQEPAWKLVRLALAHPASLCIVPLPDLLGLGSSARLNRPGRAVGNWRWQAPAAMLTPSLAHRVHDLTASAKR